REWSDPGLVRTQRALRRPVSLGAQHGRRFGRQHLHDRGGFGEARPEICPEVTVTMMTDEQLRIRGSLTAQAAKLTPAEIVEKVRVAMLQLRAAAGAVPPTRFNDPPAAGEGRANEGMAHVGETGGHSAE